MDLVKKVKDFIQSQNLLRKNETVVVGVSGGPDSAALISILHSLQYDFNLRLVVAHFNHRLRTESQRDEDFVKDLSQKLNLPFIRGEWKHSASLKKGSLEDSAREERLRFLVKAARAKKAKTIALGHHRDDLAETVLMRILRGTGLQGLQAILPKREIKGFTFIRPLLGITRKEIESYLRKNKLRFRIDATNQKIDFFRNKIRLKLLPLLEKEYKNNIKEILANLSENTAVDYDYLRSQARALFGRIGISKAKFRFPAVFLPACAGRRKQNAGDKIGTNSDVTPVLSFVPRDKTTGPEGPALASATGRPGKIVHEPCTTVQGERSECLSCRLKKSPDPKTIKFNLKIFQKEHLALQRLLMRLSVEYLKGDTNRLTLRHWKEIEALLLCRPPGAVVHLPGNIYAQKTNRYLMIGLSP